LFYIISYIVSVVFTSLSYVLSDVTLYNELSLWQPFVIGFTVVTVGAAIDKMKAPMLLIIIVPLFIGISLLYIFFDGKLVPWMVTYLVTWVYYAVFHVIFSYFFKIDSLIPSWSLGKKDQKSA